MRPLSGNFGETSCAEPSPRLWRSISCRMHRGGNTSKQAAKKLLSECEIEYRSIEVDELDGEERKAILSDIRKLNPKCSFPTIKINDTVIVGYHEKKIREALGIKDEN